MTGLGYLPDPPSEKDWSACDLLSAGAIQNSASARHLVASILDQGSLGSCVANAGMQALRASQIKAHIDAGAPFADAVTRSPLGSRLMAYYLARATHGDQQNDSGTYPRAFFEVATKFGFCPEGDWPYDDQYEEAPGVPGRFARMPNQHAFRAAYDQRAPTEYRKIFETGYSRIDAIKQAIVADHLVVFGTDVSSAFTAGAWGDGQPLAPPIGMSIAGGHAMCVTDYIDDDFGIVNSWGIGFGDRGFCRFSADYLAWERTRDLWIVKRAPIYTGAA